MTAICLWALGLSGRVHDLSQSESANRCTKIAPPAQLLAVASGEGGVRKNGGAESLKPKLSSIEAGDIKSFQTRA